LSRTRKQPVEHGFEVVEQVREPVVSDFREDVKTKKKKFEQEERNGILEEQVSKIQ
jgi:Ethanolamine utilization protein EutJ (predicted chaperonin)